MRRCRRYSYSAVALNYLTSAVVMLEGIFFIGLVQQMVFGPKRYTRSALHIPLPFASDLPSHCQQEGSAHLKTHEKLNRLYWHAHGVPRITFT